MLELWRGGHDLLKVVEQQQQALVLQNQFHQIEQWEPFELFDRKLLGDGGQEQVRVTDGGKGDERDPIDEVLGQASPEVDSQTGFANATSADQRELLTTVYTRAGGELTDPQEGCKLEDIKHKNISRRTAQGNRI